RADHDGPGPQQLQPRHDHEEQAVQPVLVEMGRGVPEVDDGRAQRASGQQPSDAGGPLEAVTTTRTWFRNVRDKDRRIRQNSHFSSEGGGVRAAAPNPDEGRPGRQGTSPQTLTPMAMPTSRLGPPARRAP